MEVSISKGRGNPPRRKIILLFLSGLLKKLQMNLPSVGFDSKIF